MNAGQHRRGKRDRVAAIRLTVGVVCIVVLSTLLQAASAGSAEEQSDTPLTAAARRADVATMRRLLGGGANPNTHNRPGATPLMFAAARPADPSTTNDTLAALKILLDHGADVNARAENGRTALMFAVASGSTARVQLLLAAGADVNARTQSGDSALFEATARGYLETVVILLQAGVRMDEVNANGQTALMVAIAQAPAGSRRVSPYEPIALTLLQHGANPNVRDRNGQSPLSLVATGDKPVLVYPLLEHHVDVNVTDPTAADATPLIIAARHGDSPLVKALLRANADVTRRDRNGKTALAYARQWGNPEIVALLTEAGAKE